MQRKSHHLTLDSVLRTQDLRTGTVLAFDYGTKRIGVAVGDLQLKLAHPLTTLCVEGSRKPDEAIARLIGEWQPVLLVVGHPFHPDGAEHELAPACKRFASRLAARFGVAAVLVDESFSSCAGAESLRQAGVTGRKQKAVLDRVAAQHILQTLFDQRDHAIA